MPSIAVNPSGNDSAINWLYVVAAAIRDDTGRILIARRHPHQHQGNRWEFPGGKVQAGETPDEALSRELSEELGIRPLTTRPLIRIRHRYPERAIILDCRLVERYSGTPTGKEGQPIRWVLPNELSDYTFPAANTPILNALALPDRYLITPQPSASMDVFLDQLEQSLNDGIALFTLRCKAMPRPILRDLARQATDLARRQQARILIHGDALLVEEIGADGIALSERQLNELSARPLAADKLVAVSCHDARALAKAEQIGASFAVLSPVKPTASHPDAQPLGWAGFTTLVDTVNLPVYALGGLQPHDIADAFRYGAQGIAAIRGLWAGTIQ